MNTLFPVMKCLVLGGLALAVFQVAAAPLTYIGYDNNDQRANGVIPLGSAFSTERARFESTLNTTGVIRETFGNSPVAGGETLSVLGGRATISQIPLVIPVPESEPLNFGLRGSVKSVRGEGANFSGRYNTTGFGSGNTSPPGAWWETDGRFNLNLNANYQAFGFDLTDFGDFNGELTMTLFAGSTQGQTLRFSRPAGSTIGNGSVLFYGFSSNAEFNRVSFNITQPNALLINRYDAVGFDQITVGRLAPSGPPGTIPEPTSLALVGISLALLGFARRRQTKA